MKGGSDTLLLIIAFMLAVAFVAWTGDTWLGLGAAIVIGGAATFLLFVYIVGSQGGFSTLGKLLGGLV